jgi:hypothetical protein
VKKVFTSSDLVLVGHLRSILEARNIACYLRNEFMSAGAGEIPSHEVWPELWVINEDEQMLARALIDEVMAAEPVQSQPWECPSCGERIDPQFSDCWSCAQSTEDSFEA